LLIFRQPQGYSLGVWEFNQALLGHVNSVSSGRSHGGERLLQIFGLACLGWELGWLGTRCSFSWGWTGNGWGVMARLAGGCLRAGCWQRPRAGWLPEGTLCSRAGCAWMRWFGNGRREVLSPPALSLPPASFFPQPMGFPHSIVGRLRWSPPSILTRRPPPGPDAAPAPPALTQVCCLLYFG